MRLIDADDLVNDFLNMCRTEFEVKNKCMTDENVLHLIQNAPTVELPEQITIKCDTEEDRQKLLSALRNVKLKAIVEDERPQGEWIPVSEKLPEKEGFYLVFLENCEMLVAHSSGIIANHDFEPKILAWQPLPEPYKEADMRGDRE